MSLKMSKNVPKMGLKLPKTAQNGSKWAKVGEWPKMGLKWPQNGTTGPFWAHFGRFWAFSGHLGPLDVILDQYAATGTSHAHKCAF